MVGFPRAGSAFALALDEAGRSPPIEGPVPTRPWLRLLGLVLTTALFLFVVIFGLVVTAHEVPGFDALLQTPDNLPDTPDRLMHEAGFALVLGLVLGLAGLSVLLAAAVAYHRRLGHFLWPTRLFDTRHFLIGTLTLVGLSVLTAPFYLLIGDPWDPPVLGAVYRDDTRLIYVGAAIMGFLVAAAAEEVVFRGVLLRIMGAVTRRPILLCIVNGALFSAFHFDPDPVVFIARALSGAVWTWATLRLGGIEFATGAHFAGNLMISLLWSLPSEENPNWTAPIGYLVPELIVAIGTIIVVERLARRSRVRSAPVEQAVTSRPRSSPFRQLYRNTDHDRSRCADPPDEEPRSRRPLAPVRPAT